MAIRQTLFISFLTLIYLVVEFAFNAKLLDVVGSAPGVEEVHSIERYGRTLSGVAVALFVLQGMLWLRGKRPDKTYTSFTSIAVACFVSGFIVYHSIQSFVDFLVESTSPEFRRASATMPFFQRSMIDGSVKMDGLSDDHGVFERPEGKSFLAMFPLMALSVERLDEKIAQAKMEIMSRQMEIALGGISGYNRNYVKAVFEVKKRHDEYVQGVLTPAEVEEQARYRADKAWAEYVEDLRGRGWTPSTVPRVAVNQVRASVRKKIEGLSPSWQTDDEGAFRSAVERKVRGSYKTSYALKRRVIPAGLSFPAFFAHPSIQETVREKFPFPERIALRNNYSKEEFRDLVFNPLVREMAEKKLKEIEAPIETYLPGGSNHEAGLEYARAVVAPPVALAFSLTGAFTHVGKLSVLLVKLVSMIFLSGGLSIRRSFYVFCAVVASIWVTFSNMSNPVTDSRLYAYLQGQVSRSPGLRPKIVSNVLHVVAVGQGYLYPMNNAIRKKIF